MDQCSFSIRGGLKHLILKIHIIVSYDQNILLIFYVKDRSHVRLSHPSCVSITAQRQYTAVQKMRTPLKLLSLHYNLDPFNYPIKHLFENAFFLFEFSWLLPLGRRSRTRRTKAISVHPDSDWQIFWQAVGSEHPISFLNIV